MICPVERNKAHLLARRSDLTLVVRSADWRGIETGHFSGGSLGGVVHRSKVRSFIGGKHMKIWNKPQVREQEVGLEVTSYLPAEIDII